jgi:putative ABC transport system permease protein
MGFQELSHAVRRLRREPVFALGVVAVLALAIGANTAMFTLVDAVLIRPLSLHDPDRLVTFTIVRPGNDRHPLSLPDLDDFKTTTRTLDGIASEFGWSANLTGSGEAERLQGARVSSDYFAITGAGVELGRTIQRDDEERRVALVSHGMWQRRFGGDRAAVGKTLILNGDAFTIVGVLRPDFVSLIRELDVVVPHSPASDPRRSNRVQGFLRVIARMKPGVTLAQVADDLGAISRRMRAEYPDARGSDTGIRVVPLRDAISGGAAPMLRLLLAAVVLVLLVACGNIANLFLVRGLGRQRELALRTALGASRSRLVAQLLVEAALLGVAGGALGLLVARAFVDALLAVGPANMPRVAEVAVNLRIAAFTAAISCGATLLFGLVPALQASRGDVRGALKEGDRAASGGTRLRTWLIVGEVALSTVLLITAALLARSFQRVQAVDPGFRPAHVLTIRLSLPRARYQGRAAIESFYDRLQPRVAALPGVRAVAAANVVPMNNYLATTAFYVDGVMIKDAPEVHYRMISPDYFNALGIGLRAGRTFTAADRSDSRPVVIVNETFARQHLRGRNPVGTRMRLDDGEKTPRSVEVVGVAADVKHFGLEGEATIEAYVPIAQVPDPTTIWLANNMYWVVRTEGAPLNAANAVRREIAEVDPSVPASFVRSMDQWMSATLEPRRFNLRLVEAFAVAALLLAVLGIYATAASALASRTREIGIRAALGASRRQVIGLVLRGGLAPVLLGLGIGTAAALASGGAVAGLLFGVTPYDPASVAAVVLTLSSAAFTASYVPARRAARVDPIVALRAE